MAFVFPPAWGWTGVVCPHIDETPVFPTCVGMDRGVHCVGSVVGSIPHLRGDGMWCSNLAIATGWEIACRTSDREGSLLTGGEFPSSPVLCYCHIIANNWKFKDCSLHAFAAVCKAGSRKLFCKLMIISIKQCYYVFYSPLLMGDKESE